MSINTSTHEVTATAQLAQWGASLRFDAIPAPVIAHIKLCVLDGIGGALFGSARSGAR